MILVHNEERWMVISDLTDSCIEKKFNYVELNDNQKQQIKDLKSSKKLINNVDVIEFYDDHNFENQLLICIRGLNKINAIHFQEVRERVLFYDISHFEYYLRTESSTITFKKIYLWNNDPFCNQKQEYKSKYLDDEYQDYSYRNLLISFFYASTYSPNLKTLIIDGPSNVNIRGLKNLAQICCRKKSIEINWTNRKLWEDQSKWSVTYVYEGDDIDLE